LKIRLLIRINVTHDYIIQVIAILNFWSNLISGFVLLNLYSITAKANPNIVYGTIIESEHYVVPKDPAAKFDKNDYYAHPEKYTSNFHEKVKYSNNSF
jgi:hypothetical protein